MAGEYMVEMNSVQVEQRHQGKLVAQYRKAANMSQSKLAEYMDVSAHTVQRLEKEAVMKDLDRRRFLVALPGIPAASMGLGEEQQSRGAFQHTSHP
jgi:DNA-binding XRE family transcriptional regulator